MPQNNNFAMTPNVLPGTPAVLPRKEMTIQDLWDILTRRRMVVLGTLLAFMTLAGIFFAVATRLYKGTAVIQVQKDSADALSMDSVIGPESQSDSVDSNITLQTQAQILQSDSLALQVVRELNLEKSKDFRSTSTPSPGCLDCSRPRALPTRPMCRWSRRPRAARKS